MYEYGNDSTASNEAEHAVCPTQVEATEQRPFLDQWGKTPYGMFVAGLFVPWLAIYLVIAILGELQQISPVVYDVLITVLGLALLAFYFIYPLRIFPSLHTDKPKLKSRNAVAFLNAFVGGIIFGSIWCSSLTTRRTKNVSQYVYVALLAAPLVIVIIMGIVSMFYTAPTATTGEARTYQVTGYTDDDSDVWYQANGTAIFSGNDISFSASCNGKQYSSTGSYVDTEEGFDVYVLRDGTYAAYGTTNGARMLMMLTENRLLYCLLLE